MKRTPVCVVVTGALGLLGCLSPEQTQPSSGSSVDGGATPRAEVLDVFLGLDNALPVRANFLCLGSGGMDGMPVTFSRRIGIDTPEPSAFQVTTRSGAGVPHAARHSARRSARASGTRCCSSATSATTQAILPCASTCSARSRCSTGATGWAYRANA